MSELQKVDTLDRQPFKNMVATIGNLPTNFVDSMSYYECLAWLCQYITGTLIPAVNNNAEAVAELQAKYIELKEYVDNYFDNLDLQTEVDAKLDEMAEDGTLERIINEEILGNVQTNVNRLYSDKKFKPLLFENLYAVHPEVSLDTMKHRIDVWKEMGIDGVIITIHFNTDGIMSLKEDLTDVKAAMDYAVDKGMIVNTIKFHWNIGNNLNTTTQLDTYQTRVDEVLNTLDAHDFGITRVTVFNELRKAYTHTSTDELVTKVISVITHIKDEGYNVGITPAGTWDVLDILEFHKGVLDAVDFISFNQYPSISYKGKLTTMEDSVFAWDGVFNSLYEIKKTYPNKQIYLSETGCTKWWDNLKNPSDYNLQGTNSNGKTYPLFYYGMFTNKVVNAYFDEVWLWFGEDITQYQDVVDWFKNYTGGNE